MKTKPKTHVIRATVTPVPMEPYTVTTVITGKRADGSIERKRVEFRMYGPAPTAAKDRTA